jgi:ParB/RepB/Spo0J family partition protein
MKDESTSSVERELDIPVAAIAASLTNPRKIFDDAETDDLGDSIVKNGLVHAVTVRPLPAERRASKVHGDKLKAVDYELVIGERRWRAVKRKLGDKATIRARVRDLTDEQAVDLQLIENAKRKDLTPIEEADAFARLVAQPGYDVARIVLNTGHKASHVEERLVLARFHDEIKALFATGKLPLGAVPLLSRVPVPVQLEAARAIVKAEAHDEVEQLADRTQHVKRPLSLAQIRGLLIAHFMLPLDRAPFPTDDAALVAKAGACGPCVKRTGNQKDMFADVKRGDVCTDKVCYEDKVAAHYKSQAKLIADRGGKVLDAKAAKTAFQGQNHNTGKASTNGYSSKLIALDEVSGYYGDNKTVADKLKAAKIDVDPKVVQLAKDPHTGEARLLVPRTLVEQADKTIRKTGTRREPKPAPTSAQKAAKLKAKIDDAATKIGRTRLLEALAGVKLPAADKLPAFFRKLLTVTLDSGYGADGVADRRGISHDDLVDKTKADELFGLFLELTFIDRIGHGEVNDLGPDERELLAFFKIDTKKIKDDARKSAEAEMKAKPGGNIKGGGIAAAAAKNDPIVKHGLGKAKAVKK